MDSITATSTLVLNLPLKYANELLIFDPNRIQKQPTLPSKFVWPRADLVVDSQEELKEPVVDLGGVRRGDVAAIEVVAEHVRSACLNHGFFQVINHDIEPDLIKAAYDEVDTISRCRR